MRLPSVVAVPTFPQGLRKRWDMLSYLTCCVVVCTGRAGVARGRHQGNNTTGEASQVMHMRTALRQQWQEAGTVRDHTHCLGHPTLLLLPGGMALLWDDATTGQGGNGGMKKVNQTAAAIRNIDGPGLVMLIPGRLRVRKHCDTR
jgi:hypothetical protein